MQPSRDEAKNALNHLLRTLAPEQAAAITEFVHHPDARIYRCIELLTTEASEAAALIA